MSAQEVTILLVDDDDVDAETVRRGLARNHIANPVIRAHDGIEALQILRGANGRPALPEPIILLVDIRMPRLDGIGLLQAIRADPKLTRMTVFILTTSDNERDRLAAYDAHVAGYFVKSDTDGQFLRLAVMLEYYLLIVASPPTPA